MKRIFWTLLACSAFVYLGRAADTNELSNEKARISYALGVSYGNGWNQQGVEVDYDMFVRGLKDSKAPGHTLMTEDQMRETLDKYRQDLAARQQENQRQLGETNKQKAEEFLAKNKTEPGIVTTDSGLQYKILAEGAGSMPGSNALVTVNYKGTLLDGTEFDSSYKRNQPWQTPVNRVIRGWTEALQQMKVGSKWQLFVPPALAYGERGRPGIPPNSLLIFDLELLTNAPPPPPPPPPGQPLTSDIIKVPSAEDMKKGAKVETIKAEDVEKFIRQQATNQSPAQGKQ
jgi:FKBP-type peptidyl-prolyl cis-trans isomerase FklB